MNFIFRDGSVYKSIAEKYKAGLVEQHYRAILSRVPRQEEAIINVPLVKTVREQNVQVILHKVKGKLCIDLITNFLCCFKS